MRRVTREEDSGSRGRQLDQLIDSLISAQPDSLAVRQGYSSVSKKRRLKSALLLSLAMTLALATVFGTIPLWGSGCGLNPAPSSGSSRSIALVDSLAVDSPNPAFVKSLSSLASSEGYSLDYYPPAAVKVDLFQHLPEKGYSMIILRTHSTWDGNVVVTSEPYDPHQRVIGQVLDRVGDANVGGRQYFSVTPSYIGSSMCGRLQGAMVLSMGCTTGSGQLAKAFMEKGARLFVSWDGLVTVAQTDSTFQALVGLLLEGVSADMAIQSLTRVSGSDHTTGPNLVLYGQ
jgi:hypothetical protein